MNRILQLSLTGLVSLLLGFPLFSQAPISLAERLGYPAGTKLLLIHADDLGVAHSVNRAGFEAMRRGPVNSASIMAPCPWLAEVAGYAQSNPNHDLGIHLTLTSEWQHIKWGPVASRSEVGSLVDANGYFYDNCDSMALRAKPGEVEQELRAQIARVKTAGIDPTHFDTHMGCLYWTNTALLNIYLKLGREYKVPLRVGRNLVEALPDSLRKSILEKDIVIDHIYSATPEDYKKGMAVFYENILRNLKPGVNEIVVHPGHKDAELRGVTINHADWGADWRQADLDFFNSDACRQLLKQENIQLITFREIGKLLK